MQTNQLNNQLMHKTIQKIEEERQVLLQTMNNNNNMQQQILELQEQLQSSEVSCNNLQDALFVILYNLKHFETHPLSSEFHHFITKLTTIIVNGLLNTSINEYYHDEILKGENLYQKALTEFINKNQ